MPLTFDQGKCLAEKYPFLRDFAGFSFFFRESPEWMRQDNRNCFACWLSNLTVETSVFTAKLARKLQGETCRSFGDATLENRPAAQNWTCLIKQDGKWVEKNLWQMVESWESSPMLSRLNPRPTVNDVLPKESSEWALIAFRWNALDGGGSHFHMMIYLPPTF